MGTRDCNRALLVIGKGQVPIAFGSMCSPWQGPFNLGLGLFLELLANLN